MFPAADDLQLLQRNNTRRTVSYSYCFPTPEIQYGVSCENVVFNFLFTKTIIFSNKLQKETKPNLNALPAPNANFIFTLMKYIVNVNKQYYDNI